MNYVLVLGAQHSVLPLQRSPLKIKFRSYGGNRLWFFAPDCFEEHVAFLEYGSSGSPLRGEEANGDPLIASLLPSKGSRFVDEYFVRGACVLA